MKKLIPVLALLILLHQGVLFAQDARFSQYFNKPLVLNPSLAGNGIEHIRITAIYRSQMSGFGTPFTTQGLSVDKVVNRVGIGAMITRNGGGEGTIKTLNLVGNLAYHLPIGSEKNHTLSAGLQLGIVNKSFDPSKLTFDNQYNPDQGYDPTQNNGEIFTTTNVTRPDMNAGFFWQRGWLKKEIRFKPFIGISFSHLTRPVETFIVDETRVEIKRTIYGGAGYMINDRFELKPSLQYLSQGTFNETTFGTNLNYQLDNKNQFQLGVYHRMNDAVIAYAGYQMNQLYVGTSYDVNTGELSKTGKGTNAFEISIAYSPRPKKKKEPEEVKAQPAKKPVVTETVPTIDKPLISNEITREIATKNTEEIKTPVTLPAANIATPVAVTVKPDVTKAPVSAPAKTELTTAAPQKAPETIQQTRAEITPATKPEISATITIPDEVVQPVAALPVTPIAVIPQSEPVTKPAVTVPVDSDKDGIPDTEDPCPFIKGGKATNGCPDSDSDGIIDMQDDCPLESGPSTNRGCPDPNVPVAKNNQELVKTFDHILFSTGSVKMTTDDLYDIVERAVDILYADKTTTVLLSGHTDSEGNEEFNMNLSQSRAEIVKAYLLKQGIAESRIQTVAYGETMPVRDNLFKENMTQNRRVELNILRNK